VKSTITEIVTACLHGLAAEKGVAPGELPLPAVEMTRDHAFGDYATNAALVLAGRFGRRPRELADDLAARLRASDGGRLLARVEVAGPGFINLTMSTAFWTGLVAEVLRRGAAYADLAVGKGKRVQVEFVSANPTGPLHVGHGRGAALGDALARVLAAAGYQVSREYYINDAGNQINTLGWSVLARYRELFGERVEFAEDWYRGAYIADIARGLRDREGDRYLRLPVEEALAEVSRRAAEVIFGDIRDDLAQFGVRFDQWFSESSLFASGEVAKTLEELEQEGHLFRDEGALWFRSTPYGDDKDRVVIKADGAYTYFASDLAYHRNKFRVRGFDRVVNIWGADHHGYIPRLSAGIQAMGRGKEDLRILLVQLVSLRRAGKPVAMSTRAGEFDTLRQVREEVGRDAARFIFLTRKSDSKLDFDLALAKAQSNDNPVYYVQYAHARICSIQRKAAEEGFAAPRPDEVDLALLALPEERDLVRHLAALPEVVEGAAAALEPHRLTGYLRDLATTLHNYYHHHRVISDDPILTRARLALMAAVRVSLVRALDLLGVSAPESM
jgi:arginyl-tRNA synthetase